MSEATCGASVPGYRFAHPGYSACHNHRRHPEVRGDDG